MRVKGRELAISSRCNFPNEKRAQCQIINTQMIVFIVLLLSSSYWELQKSNEDSAA